MKKFVFLFLFVTMILAAVPSAAHAACIDPPAQYVDWSGCDKSGLDLREVNLSDANLDDADLSGSDLTGADLGDRDFSGDGAHLSRANLSDANLSDTYMAFAVLPDSNLSGANLSGAALFLANIARSDLSGADLSGADLFLTDLVLSNLTGADLTGADLTNANLNLTELAGANLTNANLFNINGSPINGHLALHSSTTCPDGNIVSDPDKCWPAPPEFNLTPSIINSLDLLLAWNPDHGCVTLWLHISELPYKPPPGDSVIPVSSFVSQTTLSNHLGNPAVNHFYHLSPGSNCSILPSYEVGEFDFAIVAGQ